MLGVGDLAWCAVFRFDALGVGLLLATEPKLPTLSTPIRWGVLAIGVYGIVYGSQAGIHFMPLIAFGAGVVVLAGLSGPDVVLGHPVLTWLGERSYGLYILHAIALAFFRWQAMPALIATVASAALSYRFIELPCIAYSRRENTGTTVFVVAK